MARKKKKKSLIRMAAGLALRGVLKKQIVKKEQVRASAPVKGGLGILPLKSGKTGKTGKPGKSGKPVMATALYHALGGKASKEQLQEKGRVISEKFHTLYVEYLCVTDCDKNSIVLQEGETSAFRWVTAGELVSMKKEELVTERMQKFVDGLCDDESIQTYH